MQQFNKNYSKNVQLAVKRVRWKSMISIKIHVYIVFSAVQRRREYNSSVKAEQYQVAMKIIPEI